MSLQDLSLLVVQAQGLAGQHPCLTYGHEWDSDGGRACPKYGDYSCHQTVYRCKRCGIHDYGEKGGPGHRDCFIECFDSGPPEDVEDNSSEAAK